MVFGVHRGGEPRWPGIPFVWEEAEGLIKRPECGRASFHPTGHGAGMEV